MCAFTNLPIRTNVCDYRLNDAVWLLQDQCLCRRSYDDKRWLEISLSVISTELSISSLQLEGKRDHQQTHHGRYSQVGEMRVPVIDCSVRLWAVKWVLWEVTVHCGEEAANNPKTGRTILQPVPARQPDWQKRWVHFWSTYVHPTKSVCHHPLGTWIGGIEHSQTSLKQVTGLRSAIKVA